MCLAIPMKIIRIDGSQAVAEARGVETAVNTALIPDIKIGEKVIVHAGFIIERLDEEAAREIDQVWDEYLKTMDDEKRP